MAARFFEVPGAKQEIGADLVRVLQGTDWSAGGSRLPRLDRLPVSACACSGQLQLLSLPLPLHMLLQTLNEYIKDTEDMVSIKLDTHRNALITVDLVLTAFTASLAIITAISGIFGMNLVSGLEEVRGSVPARQAALIW